MQQWILLVSLLLWLGATSSSISLVDSPTSITKSTTSFSLNAIYNSTSPTASRTIVVDILDAATKSKWYGSGSTSIGTSTSGKVAITVTPSGLVDGSYVLKGWLVASSTYTSNPSTAWQSSLAENVTVTLTVGASSACNPCKLKYQGVNLAVAEFGDNGAGHLLIPNPGEFGTDYVYPEPSGSASWFANKGMNTFRIPVRWERLQKNLYLGLDTDELARLTSAINHITVTLGQYAIIDIHNYARYNAKIVGLSNGAVTNAHLADFWGLLATQYKSNSKVIFGLMNEPYDMDTDAWVTTANAAIVKIRSTGATNLILVPGTRWTGAHSWTSGSDSSGRSNAVALLNIVDSANNYAFEMHQYLDADASGTTEPCQAASYGSSALVAATNCLRTNSRKGFIGEVGASSQPTCLTSVDNILSYMDANTDVWLGWTWWAAGPWWGSYFMSIEPYSNGSAPSQFTNAIQKHICDLSKCPSYAGTRQAGAGNPSPQQLSAPHTLDDLVLGIGLTMMAVVAVAGVVGVRYYYKHRRTNLAVQIKSEHELSKDLAKPLL